MNYDERKKIKQSIKKTFDAAAQDYDSSEHFVISAQQFIQYINLDDSKEITILDLSTGTGHLAIQLAQKFPNANIYAVDLSQEMINIVIDKTQKLGIKNITYTQQDVERLDFDIKFDLITCGYGLFFYPNMDAVFCDVCSRLKVDGKFVFTTFTTQAFESYSEEFLNMLDKSFGITPPNILEQRTLKTKEQIEELSSLVQHKGLEIFNLDIKYPMEVDVLWKLFNSAGYKGLLNQLGEQFSQFENQYLKYLCTQTVNGTLEFNANSYIAIINK